MKDIRVAVALTLLPTMIGRPMMNRGTERPAIRAIPTGAPINTPSCHKIFFFLLHGFFPQNVQPDGLQTETQTVQRDELQRNKDRITDALQTETQTVQSDGLQAETQTI